MDSVYPNSKDLFHQDSTPYHGVQSLPINPNQAFIHVRKVYSRVRSRVYKYQGVVISYRNGIAQHPHSQMLSDDFWNWCYVVLLRFVGKERYLICVLCKTTINSHPSYT